MLNRNTPLPVTPHNSMERLVEGLRDYPLPPSTYKLYQQLSDGTEIYVGEYPTPKVNHKWARKHNGGV